MARRYRSNLHAYVDYRSGLLNKTQEQVAQAVGMSRMTLRSKLYHPETMTFGEFSQVMEYLKVSDFEKEQIVKEVIK